MAHDAVKSARERLMKDGFTLISEHTDQPHEIFSDHEHAGDQLVLVLEGSMQVHMNGTLKGIQHGDELFFPAGIRHSAVIGPEGCSYVTGERP